MIAYDEHDPWGWNGEDQARWEAGRKVRLVAGLAIVAVVLAFLVGKRSGRRSRL